MIVAQKSISSDPERELGLSRRDILSAGAVLALTACAPVALKLPTAENFSWELHPPEAAGLSQLALESIRASIQQNIASNRIPGAVTAIVRHNKLVWFEAQGMRDPNSGVPMRRDDIFRMMSSTKVVTAVAVLMVMEEGKLALDDPVSKFIPTFVNTKVAVGAANATEASQISFVPAARPVTIKDLLTHTSGLMSVGEMLAPGLASLVNKIEHRPGDTLASYVPRLGTAVLDFQPGTRWRYSALAGMDTLLRIVEIVSGQNADQFLRTRIFEPLQMTDTHFNVPPHKQPRVVEVFGREAGLWKVQQPLLGRGPFTYFSGAGGLFGTVHDFINLEMMLLNKGVLNGRRLLKPETVELMATNHVGTLFAEWIPAITGGSGFGLGVSIVEDESKASGRGQGAFGWGGAYGTRVMGRSEAGDRRGSVHPNRPRAPRTTPRLPDGSSAGDYRLACSAAGNMSQGLDLLLFAGGGADGFSFTSREKSRASMAS